MYVCMYACYVVCTYSIYVYAVCTHAMYVHTQGTYVLLILCLKIDCKSARHLRMVMVCQRLLTCRGGWCLAYFFIAIAYFLLRKPCLLTSYLQCILHMYVGMHATYSKLRTYVYTHAT